MANIRDRLPPHADWSTAAEAIVSHLNFSVAKESLLSPNNGGRNREVDATCAKEHFEEITAGWAFSSAGALRLLQGTQPKAKRQCRSRSGSNTSTKTDRKGDPKAETCSKVLYLGDWKLYRLLNLEAYSNSCAGPAKELATKDWLVVHRVEAVWTKKPTLSPSFFVERIRFKVSFLTLHPRTPDPVNNGAFLEVPSFTFPVFARPERDEHRELPAAKKGEIKEAALGVPRWASETQLCSRDEIHVNFLQ